MHWTDKIARSDCLIATFMVENTGERSRGRQSESECEMQNM